MKNRYKLSLTAILVSAALTANAGVVVEDEKGSFSIGGDVEFDLNYQERDSQGGDSEFDQSGRILLEFAGERRTDSGHYVKMMAQPLLETSGNVALDDAWLSFGESDGWDLRVGRFEAYDMFAVGQDTFLEYSGDSANDLYVDGSAYVYQMKEGRGRGEHGQLMYSQSFNNLYIEVAGMIGDRSNLFGNDGAGNKSYHGQEITKSKDSFVVRPVIGYQMGNLSVAASVEKNLVSDAMVTDQGVDVSDRTGYGLTSTYDAGDWTFNASYAYLDAVDETNMSLGVNVLYKGFGLGYVHAANEYERSSLTDYAEGDVKVDTVYASYEFANVMDLEDFHIYLGTYYTTVDNKTDRADLFAEDDDLGVRVRFKYFF